MEQTEKNHNNDRLLTPVEVAKILMVSRAYAYELIRKGEIRHIKIGRLRRVRRCDLDKYLETHIIPFQWD